MCRGRLLDLTNTNEISEADIGRFRDPVASSYSDKLDVNNVTYRLLYPQTSINWSRAYVKLSAANQLMTVTGINA